ncbi:MAG TPA: NUDIX domain-containing protein, partial [Gemmataceae bacterium]|nr:NUDIX domain-containing protein [Gemmataceae bacterium]
MTDITPAASVLLTRGPDAAEVLVVRRAPGLRFFGNFLAFPGGKVFASDADGQTDPLAACRMAAARELFEETGVLAARSSQGAFVSAGPELDRFRRELL